MSTELRTMEHRSRRLLIPLPMPYDDAIHTYERLVPVIDRARFGQLATPLGFMIYWRTDVTALMAGSQSGWKCVEYLMGNHTIAERMFRHDPSVMLHAPLRVVIYADQDGDTYLAVDQPSALFASYNNPAITDVGNYLDELLAGLLRKLNAPVPPEFERLRMR